MEIVSAIMENIINGKILVFPKEIAARSYIVEFAKRNPEKAVFADSAISWDTFKNRFRNLPEHMIQAQKIHRLLFLHSFVKTKEAKQFSYFINSQYPESLNLFIKTASESLPYLKKALANTTISTDVRKEAEILYNSYSNFLQANGLYEIEYFEPDYTKADKDKYVLVYPETIEDSDVVDAVKFGFSLLNKNNEIPLNPISVYENSLIEIRSVAKKIYNLLKTEKAPEIRVTINQFDDYLPYFKSECAKRGINLSIQQGKPLGQYVCGSFFKSIKTLYQTNFDLEELKSFLLNPSYPFADTVPRLETIRIGVEYKIQNSISQWTYKLSQREGIDDVISFVTKLYESIKKINNARNAEELRRSYHEFQDSFFNVNNWDTEGENKSTFQRALILIDNIDSAMKETKMNNIPNFYELFLSLLSLVSYTPNAKTDGIKVYSYPQTKGIYAKHHFVLGLSDSFVQQSRKTIPFLSETEQDEESITDCILRSYANINDNNIYLSCALDSFGGISTEPCLFTENNAVNKCIISSDFLLDPFVAESAMWAGENNETLCTEKQKQQYFQMKDALVRGQKKEKFATVSLPFSLSATSISEFVKCPYRWLCRNVYGLREQDYVVDLEDYAGFGILVHETYAEFFEKIKYFDKFNSLENKELLKHIFNQKLEKESFSYKATDKLHLLEKKEKNQHLLSLLFEVKNSELFSSSVTEKMEENGLRVETPEYTLNGRIDCIMKYNDGNYAVIDFKTGKADKESLQLCVYADLMKKNDKYAKYPIVAAFYSLKEKIYTVLWKDESDFNTKIQDYENAKNLMVERITNANFYPTPSKDSCKLCPYSGICRKRYVVK